MPPHPDVQIYVGHIDRELNSDAYICPGLGDAGDRILGQNSRIHLFIMPASEMMAAFMAGIP